MGKVWSLIRLLPSFLSLFNKLWEYWQDYQTKKRQEKQAKAIKEMEKAKTPEDVWKANEEITRNLP